MQTKHLSRSNINHITICNRYTVSSVACRISMADSPILRGQTLFWLRLHPGHTGRPLAPEHFVVGIPGLDIEGCRSIGNISEPEVRIFRNRNSCFHAEQQRMALP